MKYQMIDPKKQLFWTKSSQFFVSIFYGFFINNYHIISKTITISLNLRSILFQRSKFLILQHIYSKKMKVNLPSNLLMHFRINWFKITITKIDRKQAKNKIFTIFTKHWWSFSLQFKFNKKIFKYFLNLTLFLLQRSKFLILLHLHSKKVKANLPSNH